ncbi:hypothetical protein MMC16_007054 [Acarospora aff. strigata]|nr:hypothetical protein [Acarospora aff. strigata]
MAFTFQRSCFICALILLALVSIVTLALNFSTLDYISSKYETGGFVLDPYDQTQRMIGTLPLYIYIGPAKLASAAGVISLITSVAVIIFVACLWPNGSRTYRFAPGRLYPSVLLLNALLSFAALILLFVTHAESAHFDPTYKDRAGSFGPGSYYANKAFDLETWACDLAAYPGAQLMYKEFSKRCGTEKAGRWMMLPFCVLAFAATGVALWALWSVEDRVMQGKEEKQREQYMRNDGWEETGDGCGNRRGIA